MSQENLSNPMIYGKPPQVNQSAYQLNHDRILRQEFGNAIPQWAVELTRNVIFRDDPKVNYRIHQTMAQLVKKLYAEAGIPPKKVWNKQRVNETRSDWVRRRNMYRARVEGLQEQARRLTIAACAWELDTTEIKRRIGDYARVNVTPYIGNPKNPDTASHRKRKDSPQPSSNGKMALASLEGMATPEAIKTDKIVEIPGWEYIPPESPRRHFGRVKSYAETVINKLKMMPVGDERAITEAVTEEQQKDFLNHLGYWTKLAGWKVGRGHHNIRARYNSVIDEKDKLIHITRLG